MLSLTRGSEPRWIQGWEEEGYSSS